MTTHDEDFHGRSTEEEYRRPDIYRLLSGVYCMLLVILSIIICSSHHSIEDVSELTVDTYYTVLTAIGSIWLISFGAISTRCGRNSGEREQVKSSHSTNRWLKAILVIFGVAVIIRDILEVLTTTQYTDPDCKSNVMYYLSPISEMIFIIAQVNFLFRYSKIHLQGQITLNRFGTMHVIATNLSIWILLIIDEAASDNESSQLSLPTALPTSTSQSLQTTSLLDECNNTEILNALNQGRMLQPQQQARRYYSTNALDQLVRQKGCTCDTQYCLAATEANSYLYPFLVEFTLVASCLIYIIWKNVGKPALHTSPSVKPSYKFYQSYLGLAVGIFCLIVTAVVLIFVNYGIEGGSSEGDSYDYHITAMTILNGYMVGVELAMLISCFVGAGLFRKERRILDVELNLDIVLLLFTLIGVATINMYYIFAVYISFISPKYDYHWIWGAVYPIVDLLQCIFQAAFILWGSSRRPVIAEHPDDDHVEFSQPQSSITSADSGIGVGFRNDAFRISEIHTPYDEFGKNTDIETGQKEGVVTTNDDVAITKEDVSITKEDVTITKDDVSITKEDASITIEEATTSKDETGFVAPELSRRQRIDSRSIAAFRRIPKIRRTIEENALQERIRRHEERPRIAAPSLIRLRIRETVMFLLICNACLWMFWSFEGPFIKEMAYPNQYYESHIGNHRNLWRSATMFCLPLAIFFRMHSCACFFEMWSFT